MTFLEILLDLMMTLMFLTGAGFLDDNLDCFHYSWLKSDSLKASRSPSMLDDISRALDEVDEDFGVPDWGLCP